MGSMGIMGVMSKTLPLLKPQAPIIEPVHPAFP